MTPMPTITRQYHRGRIPLSSSCSNCCGFMLFVCLLTTFISCSRSGLLSIDEHEYIDLENNNGATTTATSASATVTVTTTTTPTVSTNTQIRWKRNVFPIDPALNADRCRSMLSPHRFCDPDGILLPLSLHAHEQQELLQSNELLQATHVEQRLQKLALSASAAAAVGAAEAVTTAETRTSSVTESAREATAASTATVSDNVTTSRTGTIRHPCPQSNEEKASWIEVQYGVALVNQIDLEEDGLDVPELEIVEHFARSIHDTWGVGKETERCGGTGVLIFLSIQDRLVYISRGQALDRVLTDARLDCIMQQVMKPPLQEGQYEQAILDALDAIETYIQRGEADWRDFLEHNYGFLIMLSIVGIFWRASHYRDTTERRDYARVRSHLSEIDQRRAESLQGQYRATSCPICLEPFQEQKQEAGKDSSCSHEGEACDQNDEGASKGYTLGSDGKALRLLRCGHVFDETCFLEWVNTGQGRVDTCPICQADVGTTSSGRAIQRSQNHRIRGRLGFGSGNNDRVDRGQVRVGAPASQVMQLYQRERAFRLARLVDRYPRYVRQEQVQRWSDPANANRPLVQDPDFARRDPAVRDSSTNSSSSAWHGSSMSSGFGGGLSAGGRGGSW